MYIRYAREKHNLKRKFQLKLKTGERPKHISWSKVLLYSLAFLLPVIIMAIVYICIGVYPFGEKSLLTIDLYHQYIDFFSYYRQSLLSFQPQNLLYSFSKTLGGNMIGLFAYYLASPLNIIFLFFKTENLSEAIFVLTLIKIGLCGVTFTAMCRKMFNFKTMYTLVFSTCYALMAYNIVFQQNIMWLDGVIWLPVIALGIYNIVTKNSFVLYTVSLVIALLSNYYIGYMLCIFSVLFFIYEMVAVCPNSIRKKQITGKIWRFIGASILAGGIAACLLLPTFISLQNGKATFDASRFSLDPNFEFVQLLQKLFIGEMDIELLHQGLDTTLPDIFCGTFITLSSFLYFFNKNISFKEKAASAVMVFILVISLHIKAFDLVWHGLNTPVGFLYRNAFLVSFFGIFLSVRTFMNPKGITKGNIMTCLGIFIAIAILVNNFSLESLTAFEIYLTIGFFMVYCLILGLFISGKKSAYLLISLMLLIAVEFEISGCLTLEDLSHVSRETYSTSVKNLDKALARLRKIDPGEYRIDKNFMRSRNDGMMHAYKTITHSSSTADFGVVEFLNKLGYRNESNIGNSYDYGSTLPADSLLSIKYVLSNTNQKFQYYTDSGYSDNIKILKNPYALPFMFKANSSVLNTQDAYNIFELQNDLYTYMTGCNDVLTPITDIQITMDNLTKTSNGKNVNYHKNAEEEEAYIEYTFTAINNDDIYAHFPTEPISDSTVEVYVNGVKIRDHLDSNHLTYYDVLNLGNFNKGETVKLKLVLTENETNFENHFIYALNLNNFNQAYSYLAADPMDFEIANQNHIKAKVKNVQPNQLVFTSIPYDKGWSVYVDGKRVQPSIILDTLMAIQTGSGDHEIEMKYMPPGLNTGILISVFSIGALIVAAIFTDDNVKKKRMSKKQKTC